MIRLGEFYKSSTTGDIYQVKNLESPPRGKNGKYYQVHFYNMDQVWPTPFSQDDIEEDIPLKEEQVHQEYEKYENFLMNPTEETFYLAVVKDREHYKLHSALQNRLQNERVEVGGFYQCRQKQDIYQVLQETTPPRGKRGRWFVIQFYKMSDPWPTLYDEDTILMDIPLEEHEVEPAFQQFESFLENFDQSQSCLGF